jgi:hypothetical protein
LEALVGKTYYHNFRILVHWWPLVLQLVQTVWKPDDHSELINMGRISTPSWLPVFRFSPIHKKIQVRIYQHRKCSLLCQLDVSTVGKKHVFGLWIFMSCCWYTRPFR